MIIKSLSRKNASGKGQLVRYIFKYIFRGDPVGRSDTLQADHSRDAPKSIALTDKDRKYLLFEKKDRELLNDFYARCPDGDVQKYLERYVIPREFKFSPLRPFIIKHNVRGHTLQDFIKAFEKAEQGRIHKRHDQTAIHHTIISFSNRDTKAITEDLLQDICRQYISLRGERNVYVGTVHLDKDHIHVHLGMSATSIDGKSSRISKEEFESIKVKLQEYQQVKFPQLVHSVVEHGKGKRLQKEQVKTEKYIAERSSGKQSLLQCMETSFASAGSPEQFISLIRAGGYTEYYRGNALTGVVNEKGYKYRFSRLGVDLSVLEARRLEKINEEVQLKDLESIRSGGARKREIAAKGRKEEQEPVLSEAEQEQLTRLDTLREGRDTGFARDSQEADTGRQQDDDRERGYSAPDDDDTDDSDEDSQARQTDDSDDDSDR